MKVKVNARVVAAAVIIAWAAGLHGHMMYMQRQGAFRKTFGSDGATEVAEKKDSRVKMSLKLSDD